ALYVCAVRLASRAPDLPESIDLRNPVLPPAWPTVQAGLHFLIPIGVLIWCLLIEQLSPATAAFWATATLVGLMLTQPALTRHFRGARAARRALGEGLRAVADGFEH